MMSFELCNDSELLRSYYSLREQCYRRELGLADFDGAEEQADRDGDLLIAHSGGRCLGGARIARLESVAVQLEESMLPPGQSCVWERLVLNPDYRSLDLARQVCDQLVMASWQLGYDQALVLSSLRNARFYRRCMSAIGAELEILGQLPDNNSSAFSGLEHYLSLARWQATDNAMRLAA